MRSSLTQYRLHKNYGTLKWGLCELSHTSTCHPNTLLPVWAKLLPKSSKVWEANPKVLVNNTEQIAWKRTNYSDESRRISRNGTGAEYPADRRITWIPTEGFRWIWDPRTFALPCWNPGLFWAKLMSLCRKSNKVTKFWWNKLLMKCIKVHLIEHSATWTKPLE